MFAPDSGAVVGEVSVGYSTETISQSLARDIVPIALTAAGALLVGVLASFLLRRRLQRLTLGLEPEEISTLVHDQVAVLQGVDDGVIGVAADGRISVFNAAAQRLLGQPDLTGTPWAAAPVPAQLNALTRADAAEGDAVELVAGGRVLVASARKALHGREDLGWVVMLRDRTELQQLTRQLDAVGTMSTALAGPAARVRQPAPHHRRLHEHRPAPAGPRLPGPAGRHRAAEVPGGPGRAAPGPVPAGLPRRQGRGSGRTRREPCGSARKPWSAARSPSRRTSPRSWAT